MKKIFTILMVLMVLGFTQCKPTPEGGDDNTPKVRVSCVLPMGDDSKSDFSNLMTDGKIKWSDGRECVYLAIHGDKPQIIELDSWAEGYPSTLEFTGEAAEGLIVSDEEYDVWYFGHSKQLNTPYFNLANDGSTLTGSIANQSGRLNDLGYCHIAKTKVKATTESGEVKLNLSGVFNHQIAIALLDLNNVTELYGDAIVGTEYALEYNGKRFELNVVENSNAKIKVESASGTSYVVLLPNDEKETNVKVKRDGKTYAYTFHNYIKSNNLYYRTALDGTVEVLPWTEIGEEINEIDGHEYVDLGLPSGLLWATCNIGAATPEAYGDYYAWGETEVKDKYDSGNCSTYDIEIENISGNLQYDAATVNWGSTWRMPTAEEFQELIDKCTWSWTTQNGVNGYKVTGPNDKHIFLPAAGYRSGAYLLNDDEGGSYWTSNSNEKSYNKADCLIFYSSYHYLSSFVRSGGRSVRPVSGGNFVEPEGPNANGHEYVDLGLSVKWATCNVGAEKPEDYGNYYAWGEITTKNQYTSGGCSTNGVQIGDIAGNTRYDAAAANWGGDWRMPTKDEMNELINNCTWTWTTQNDVNVFEVTGPNGNSIILPPAGYRNLYSLNVSGTGGWYWSSTPLDNSYDDSAYGINVYNKGVGKDIFAPYRYNGLTIRPVIE